MIRLPLAASAALLLASAASAQLVFWDLSADATPVTGEAPSVASNAGSSGASGTLTRGPAFTPDASNFQASFGVFNTNTSFGASDLATAVSGDFYTQFSVNATGPALNISSVSVVTYNQNDAGNFELQYSVGGPFAAVGAGVTGANYSGVATLFDTTGIAALQGITSATFRVYFWNTTAWGSRGIGGINGSNADIAVNGSTIPEPSTYAALAGLGALALVVVRRRRA